MLSLALSKPLIGLAACISISVPVGGVILYTRGGGEEPIYGDVVLVEKKNPYTKSTPDENQMLVKCKLEGGTSFDFCSLGKMTDIPERKWVDMKGFKAFSFNSSINKVGFFTKDETFYKAEVSGALIAESLDAPNKKLQVFKHDENENKSDNAPLITLNTTFAINNQDGLKGNMQYMLGRTQKLTAEGGAKLVQKTYQL